MKPKIFHVLDDHSVGGITATTRHISHSYLKDDFDFHLVRSKELLSLLQTECPDLVIFHNPSSWRRSLNLALIKLYVPHLIIHEHHYSEGFTQHKVKNLQRFYTMLQWSYHRADRVVAISQGQANWMEKNRLVPLSKLTMINQCPNLDRFLNVPIKVRASPLILAAYGRFCVQKGFDILLHAMRLIPDANIHLNIGGSGSEVDKLYSLAQGTPNIKFWGEIEDTPMFLSAADVVVIPSRWEPWGNVCIEARAAGKPIIASDIDGLSEQVKNCGILIPPNDPQLLAEAIRSVTFAPAQQLENWGHNARASVDRAGEIYLETWRSLLWKTLQS
ncbi:MAG: glycosyltransferase family 4 protein [Leptolyngbyaceae cyanobacterium CSU_1_4]|nr:glycosyltransferase family 4 protein [Leptolyngbyaceae cyanobacterium CSU_1_4]